MLTGWKRSRLATTNTLLSACSSLAILALLTGGFTPAQSQTIAFIQSNYAVPSTSTAAVTVLYPSTQVSGDLNVVVVGWADSTAQISSVTDSKGNVYLIAAGPTVQTGSGSQAIYYAKNISAASPQANAVTVKFNVAARFPDVRIAEYSGIDPTNSLDVFAAAQGNSATSISGAVTTTNANDLLVGANDVRTGTTGAGPGYTERMISSPNGDILEDRIVTAVGSYSASAPVAPSGGWVMQMVAFRAAGGSGGTVPLISSLSPTSGAVGKSVTISGANFGAAPGTSAVTFNGISTTPTSWSATNIVAPVPSGATTGNVVATVSGLASNGVAFTVQAGAPAIAFVQINSATPQSPQTSVTVPFTAPQSAGDLNVVTVGWFDATSSVVSVADTLGNVYSAAVGPTRMAGTGSLSIYYAKNIAAAGANANSVTVNFSAAVPYPEVDVMEYRGLDPLSPLDVFAAGTGNGTVSNSGAATTTNAHDLILGVNNVTTGTNSAGTNFTKRIITVPNGNIVEDRIVAAAGSYSATANLTSGGWIMQMVAFKAAGGSGGATPTAPTNLAATAASSSQINLTWTASTETGGTISSYQVARCQGAGCSTFTQVGTSTTTSFNDTGLTASTSYSYEVRALDNSNNTGPYSTVATTTTLAAVTPTAPTNLTPTVVSNTQINLTWTASTETGGTISSYQVARCQGAGCSTFTQVGTSTTTSFNDTGLTGATSYSYEVRALDNSNNTGPYSTVATATTQPPTFTPPSNLVATAAGSSQINLTWTAGTETGGTITAYLVQRCLGASCSGFAQIGTATGTTYSDATAAPSTTYSYRVQASDAGNNVSAFSNTASATTQAAPAAIAYVQSNYAVPQSPQASVPVTFGGAQTAGDLNVVAVGWFDTITGIVSVTDTKGNVYVPAVGPTPMSSTGTQAIYYAKNIAAAAANANTVTVAFSGAAPYPDVRILEYSGLDGGNPIDVIAAGTGRGSPSNSGAAITSSANDLIFGADDVASSTTGPGAKFTTRELTVPDGDIAEDDVVSATGSYAATATMTPGTWIMQMVAFRAAGGSSADHTSPTAPSNLTTADAGGNQTYLSWTASTDPDSAVSSYLIERCQGTGCSTFTQVAAMPGILTSYNDPGLVNGTTYSYRVRASDPSGNLSGYSNVSTSTAGVASPPAVIGQWAGPFTWPMVGIHATLMPTGKVLSWEDEDQSPAAQVWDPSTMALTAVPYAVSDLFCSGHTILPDGRIMVAGGHNGSNFNGIPAITFFNPSTLTWSSGPNMAFARWYPTVTALPDGRDLITSGAINCQGCNANTPEIFDPAKNTVTQLNAATIDLPLYPHMFVIPDGRVLVTGSYELPVAAQALNLTTQAWTTIDPNVHDAGSAIMYLPGKILETGTSANSDSPYTNAVSDAYVLDMTQSSPAWKQIASMAFARSYQNMTVLPDGTVLVTGGESYTNPFDLSSAVYAAEIWSPTTQTWATMASAQVARVYHSTALLLPDGRVLVTGSGEYGAGSIDSLNVEIYSPPYLFKGTRPTISSVPATLTYGQPFAVQTPNAGIIASVVLIRLGSVTHAFNQNQRYVPLAFTAGSGSLTVTAPANANLAPPGYYMLFIVDSNGIPSVAPILQVPVQ
ncbi:MAG TPA: fibronectin type III domain-containing protein [Candidatus Sulfotelmatobacter sp.]|nr:fibronectin type III domain-containing protein [Candidatus Sulfotelmatobacter sp.]